MGTLDPRGSFSGDDRAHERILKVTSLVTHKMNTEHISFSISAITIRVCLSSAICVEPARKQEVIDAGFLNFLLLRSGNATDKRAVAEIKTWWSYTERDFVMKTNDLPRPSSNS